MIENKIKNIDHRIWCRKKVISSSDSYDWLIVTLSKLLNLSTSFLIYKTGVINSYLIELWALNECSSMAQTVFQQC